MTPPTIADYLKYADLQMAAEAFIRDPDTNVLKVGSDVKDALIDGNFHSSKFTETQAENFVDPNNGWKVLDQIPNKNSGFSGTLFENNNTGELVLSFRSTEFTSLAVVTHQETINQNRPGCLKRSPMERST